MCIHYLQCGLETPILPSIQEAFKNRFNEEYNASNINKDKYFEELKMEFWVYESKATLSELLLGFLKYYGEEFDFATNVISIRQGKKITREEIGEVDYSSFGWGYVCIEEPFTLKNTAYSVYDPVVFEAIKKCFKESYQLLKKTNDFDSLLSEKSIKEYLGDYALIPQGGVVYKTPDSKKLFSTKT